MTAQAEAEYRAVSRQSASEVVAQHSALVARIAHHMVARLPASVDVNDLIQAGTIGLIEATRSYDPSQGAAFETYASIRIRGSMLDEIRRSDWVPRSVHRRVREAAAATQAIEQRTGRAARSSEIANAMQVTAEELNRIMEDAVRGHVLSIDAHVDDSGELRLPASEFSASPSRDHEREAFGDSLTQAIEALPEREQLVMSLYYEQELNLKEIGAVLGVSESRVCQIHGQALVRLRARLADWIAPDLDAD
ncbi:MAG TPA: RNA polymerase sigma factor FliA [Aquimonas sp.]|nr:RNA polymerase sigma factor FliA [Xanthomonadales bacterium]HRF55218.1 RNA polymerase sigma factor FliA [Aquimonas sp.]